MDTMGIMWSNLGEKTSRSRLRKSAVIFLVLLVAASVTPLLLAWSANGSSQSSTHPPDSTAAWLVAAPGYGWSFPSDHWSHPGYRTEWWYFTGHLQETITSPKNGNSSADHTPLRFGYQFTFFRVGLTAEPTDLISSWAANDIVMGHASITDLNRGQHVFSEVLYRAVPMLGGFGTVTDSVIAWSQAPAGTDARWELSWHNSGFTISMRDDAHGIGFVLGTKIAGPPVLQGPGGYSRKGHGPTSASLYYSFPRLDTAGTLTLNGKQYAVAGVSWMDREFGSNQLDADQVGWDWLSLQLADGRDLMLYHLRRADGTVDFARGTLVGSDGQVHYLQDGDWSWQSGRKWRSKRTKAEYPVRWQLILPGIGATAVGAEHSLNLEIQALVEAQENVSSRSGVHYWEGAVEAIGPDGEFAGRGYVELTGYGEGARPPI
jgi:predicted secreted hydrolase